MVAEVVEILFTKFMVIVMSFIYVRYKWCPEQGCELVSCPYMLPRQRKPEQRFCSKKCATAHYNQCKKLGVPGTTNNSEVVRSLCDKIHNVN